VYIHYLKRTTWARFQLYCITFVSSSHQYSARPCLSSLILDPSISNNNLMRLNLIIKLLSKLINFRFLITDLNNAQICSKMPRILNWELGVNFLTLLALWTTLDNFRNIISNVGGNRSSQRETWKFLDELFMFSTPLDCIQDCLKNDEWTPVSDWNPLMTYFYHLKVHVTAVLI
jgi:hypothetical protein